MYYFYERFKISTQGKIVRMFNKNLLYRIKKTLWLLSTVFFCAPILHSQQIDSENFGLRFNVLFSIGSHQQNLGLQFSTFVKNKSFQVNGVYSLRFSLKNLGKRKNVLEHRFAPGLHLIYNGGPNRSEYLWNELRTLASNGYSLGYSYIWYFDNVKTSQRSGAFGLGLKDFQLSFENDIFGGQGKDRFRTAQFDLCYFQKLEAHGMPDE